jgi:cysteine desulfurase
MRDIYLDHNATTPLSEVAHAAMVPFLTPQALGAFGNPSSLHAIGRAARGAVERARDEVAALIGASTSEVAFTSGGCESNNWAILGGFLAARSRDARRRRVLVSAVEHPSITALAPEITRRGGELILCPVDDGGRVDLERFADLLDDTIALSSVQLANHEIGVIQPVAELATRVRACGALVHCDAIQACGKMPVEIERLRIDLLSISAHKIGGPKGVGALFIRNGIVIEPLLVGGGQERSRRGGTENVAGVVGFGAAAAVARESSKAFAERMAPMKERLKDGLLALGARVNGGDVRVANTMNVGFEGVSGQLLAMNLDLEGVYLSTGAACSSGSLMPSPVLLALGQSPARAKEGVRFSLGEGNTLTEINHVLGILPGILERIRNAGLETP